MLWCDWLYNSLDYCCIRDDDWLVDGTEIWTKYSVLIRHFDNGTCFQSDFMAERLDFDEIGKICCFQVIRFLTVS